MIINFFFQNFFARNFFSRTRPVTHRSGRVKDLQHALLPLHLHLLPVGVLDRRVVLLHEDALRDEQTTS